MFEEIIEINGKEKGPTSIILAGVHGNEKCGVEAFQKIIPNLEIEKGTVLFGYGNPRAIETNQRFTGANLNRMFKNDDSLSLADKNSYEYKRAQFLKTYLNQSDALLDIHASTNPKSKPFVICEPNAKEVTQYLPIDTVVYGFDKVEPGGTDYYMNSIGKIGICVECGYFKDTQSIQTAEECVFSFLKACGHITKEMVLKKQSTIQMYELYMTKTDRFILSKPFADFEEILKGQVVGKDGEEEIIVKKNSIILFAKDRTKIGEEGFLLGEKI